MTGIALSGTPTAAPATGQPTTPPTTQTTPPPSTTPTTPPAGTPPVSTGSTDPAATGTTSPWYSTLQDATLKEFAEKKGWKDPEAQLKSHMELEKAFSTKQAATAPPADVSGYTFSQPKDLPDGVGYNAEFAGAFKSWALASKLSPEQAAGLHDAFVSHAKQTHTTSAEAQTKALGDRVTAAVGGLEAALTSKNGTPEFSRNIELAKRAIRMSDPKMMDALKEAGVIVTVGGQDMVANATVFAAFAKMGAGMFAEDTLHGEPTSGANPFDAKTESLTQQGWLIKNDPEKAKLLIHAAGPKMIAMYADFLARK